MWYGATETWAAAGLLSLVRRKTTSCGNGWLETMKRCVWCNWNKASLLRDGKTWEPTILSSQTTLRTMQTQRKTFRLGRRPAKQGPRPLSSNQGRVEKSVTGSTTTTMKNTTRLSQGQLRLRKKQTRHMEYPQYAAAWKSSSTR